MAQGKGREGRGVVILSEAKDWQRMRFKKNKVWQALDNAGQPLVKNGKVLIKYQLEQDYEYWVHPSNVPHQ